MLGHPEGSQHRPLAFSPEGIELKAESGVLHSQSRMTAEEESRETKQKQHEGRHEARFLVYIVMKVKPLRVGGLLANHSLNHFVILNAKHLKRALKNYFRYYHESRTHLGLAKQCPIPRLVSSRGRIIEIPQLGGLHHPYERIAV